MEANNELLLRGVPMDGISQLRAYIPGINLTQLMVVKSNFIMNPSTNMTYRRQYSFSTILHQPYSHHLWYRDQHTLNEAPTEHIHIDS